MIFYFHEKSNPLTSSASEKKPACCNMKAMKPIKVFAPYEKQGQGRQIFLVSLVEKRTPGVLGTLGTQGTQEHTRDTGGTGDAGDTGDKRETGNTRDTGDTG